MTETKKVSELDLVHIDVETNGLDHKQFRVIEVAAVRLLAKPNPDGDFVVLDQYETKIKMSPGQRAIAQPRALEVNGYTDEEWADAPPDSPEIWQKIQAFTKDAVLVGQNVGFDQDHILAEMTFYGLKPLWQRRFVDLQAYSFMIAEEFGLSFWGLQDAYAAIAPNGPHYPSHRAMADVQRGMAIYKYARNRYFR